MSGIPVHATYDRLGAFERTSTQTDFSSLTAVLQAGPRQRGTERKEFVFTGRIKGAMFIAAYFWR